MSIKDQFTRHIHSLQNKICLGLEEVDGKAKFRSDVWERPGGGGGDSRVISGGDVFEKGGVNVSVVHGDLTQQAAQQLKVEGTSFFACGLSLVIHPFNPFVPTVHANWRYFELYNESGATVDAWFGGGTDLTPYYLVEEDVVHFHSMQKKCCEDFDTNFYPTFKKQCDNYFSNHHRGEERRGVGGIFFDHCRANEKHDLIFWKNFMEANGLIFLDGYSPIVNKRKHAPFSDYHKYWQEIRRGRYVEFNLLHDRGTLFGIKTNGRTESILMSLPPTVRFDYDYQPATGSEEEKLLQILKEPIQWV
ncbi:MAG: oxygen-dependent coproporphyrinogen oxidase [Bacteroidia bacterium]|nr:oxygen-dependent coproporphyrinogen oxidase [Bacteroidia bacterium]